jgi:hypothetical protein
MNYKIIIVFVNMSDIISFANSYFYMCLFKYFCLHDCNIYNFVLNITSICCNDDFYLCVGEEHAGEDALIMLVFLVLMYIIIYPSMYELSPIPPSLHARKNYSTNLKFRKSCVQLLYYHKSSFA